MEILELLAVFLEAGEACGCFVQLVAAVADGAAAVAGVSAVKEKKKRRRLRAEGIEPEGANTKLIAFWVLFPFALVATGLAVASIIAALRR